MTRRSVSQPCPIGSTNCRDGRSRQNQLASGAFVARCPAAAIRLPPLTEPPLRTVFGHRPLPVAPLSVKVSDAIPVTLTDRIPAYA